MNSILFVNSCIRGELSRTFRLARCFIGYITQRNPDIVITERKLSDAPPAFLTNESLLERDKLIGKGDLSSPSFALAHEFATADGIIVAAPFWDNSFPAMLRSYIERIFVNGICFKYTEKGSVGLCCAKILIYITTRGGCPDGDDLGEKYLMNLSGMFGIARFDSVAAEGLDIYGEDTETILKNAEVNLLSKAEHFSESLL